jgi:hypothetical protein
MSTAFADRGQGIPKLVREYRQELILATVGDPQRLLRGGELLAALFGREIGDEHADQAAALVRKRVERKIRRDERSVGLTKPSFSTAGALRPGLRE